MFTVLKWTVPFTGFLWLAGCVPSGQTAPVTSSSIENTSAQDNQAGEVNAPIYVDAGPDISLNGAGLLVGECDGRSVSCQWTQTAGSGSLTFDFPTSPITRVHASSDGVYEVTLTATLKNGETASDEMTLTFNTAGLQITGARAYEGRTELTTELTSTISGTYGWTQIAGNGQLQFNTTDQLNVTVTGNTNGLHKARLTSRWPDGSVTHTDVDFYFDSTPPNTPVSTNARDTLTKESAFNKVRMQWDPVTEAIGYIIIGPKPGALTDAESQGLSYSNNALFDSDTFLADGETYSIGQSLNEKFEVKAIIQETDYLYEFAFDRKMPFISLMAFDRFYNYSRSGVFPSDNWHSNELEMVGVLPSEEFPLLATRNSSYELRVTRYAINVYRLSDGKLVRSIPSDPNTNSFAKAIRDNDILYVGTWKLLKRIKLNNFIDMEALPGINSGSPLGLTENHIAVSLNGGINFYNRGLAGGYAGQTILDETKGDSITWLSSSLQVLYNSSTKTMTLANLSTPGQPVYLGSFTHASGLSTFLLDGNLLYARSSTQIFALDISNPENISLSETLSISGPNNIVNLQQTETHLYFRNNEDVYEIAKPLTTQTLTPPKISLGSYIRASQLEGDSLVVTTSQFSYRLNLPFSESPGDVNNYIAFPNLADARTITSHNNHLIVGGYREYYILSLEDPKHPQLVSYTTDDLTKQGWVITPDHIGFAIYSSSNHVQAYDLSDPAAPLKIGNALDVPGGATELQIFDDHLYVACGNEGLAIYDIGPIRNGQPLQLIGSLSTNIGNIATFTRYGNTVYGIGYGDASIYVIDVTTEAAPSLTSTINVWSQLNIGGGVHYGWIDFTTVMVDHYLFAALSYKTYGFDMSDPAAPVEIFGRKTISDRDYYSNGGQVLHRFDHYLVVGDDYSWEGVNLFDVSDPLKSRLVSRSRSFDDIETLTVHGNFLYAIDREAGLLVYDLTEVRQP